MGSVKEPLPVALICAITFADASAKDAAMAALQARYGSFAFVQEPFSFHHTTYYEEEMGSPLFKQLVVFTDLTGPLELPAVKVATNAIESGQAQGGRRRVNLDPGYLAPARLVLASTKDFAHRVYLGQGIYGEVTLLVRGGALEALPWTYPDYRDPGVQRFLMEARLWYLGRLEGRRTREE